VVATSVGTSAGEAQRVQESLEAIVRVACFVRIRTGRPWVYKAYAKIIHVTSTETS